MPADARAVPLPSPPPAQITKIESDENFGAVVPMNPRVVFARTAPAWAWQPHGWWLRIDVAIRNTSAAPISITQFTVDTDVTVPEQVALAAPVAIPANSTRTILVPGGFGDDGAMPATVGVRANVAGYIQPIERIQALVEYASPTPSGGFAFPGRSGDIADGVYWHTGVHAHTVTQRYAYDFGARRWDAVANSWRSVTAASVSVEQLGGPVAGSANSHHLIWNVPVYAIANATIVRCSRSLPDHAPGVAASGGGNTVILDLGNGTFVKYYHLRQFSVPAALCPVEGSVGGDDTPLAIPVVAGQQLGRIGDSGHSSAPHLHLEHADGPGPDSSTERGLPLRFNGIRVRSDSYNPETDITGWHQISASESAVPVDALVRPPCGPPCALAPAG